MLAYLINLQKYNKALKSRNVILRKAAEDKAQKSMLVTYENMLIQYGTNICLERFRLLEKLGPKISTFTAEMFPENKKLKLLYQSSLGKVFIKQNI